MGAAPHFQLNLFGLLDLPVQVISRPASSSPSVGQMKRHVEQQQELINAAFAPVEG
jgi:2-oxoglutarate dehydrogenase E1 component